jgi:hypothetical protein
LSLQDIARQHGISYQQARRQRQQLLNLTLAERLRAVEILEPRSAGGLQAFGLRWDLDGDLAYQNLD